MKVEPDERAREGQPLRAAIVPHVAEAGGAEQRGQRTQGLVTNAADLEVAPAGHVHMAVAEAAGAFGHGTKLVRR